MAGDGDAAGIRLIVCDVDGVLTDGRLFVDGRGGEAKAFHVRDGQGLRLWMRLGLDVAFISGRASPAALHRARELGVRHVFQGVRDKRETFGALLEDLGLTPARAAMIGDDLPDLAIMRMSGYPVAVADAVEEVRQAARYVTDAPGGHGAVREAIEHLLRLDDRWDDALTLFDGSG
jgi:YrbI family 3-deoxy-D-manno-octulosonate 8-phosphate phosphatase